jgi:HSP20 family protein
MLLRYNIARPSLPAWAWQSAASNGWLHPMMARLFDESEPMLRRNRPDADRVAANPRAQLRDLGEAVSMLVDVPGASPDQIELSIEATTVTLRVEVPPSAVPEGFTALKCERRPGRTEWSFELPYTVDAGAATASLVQGRLSVMLPKVPEAKPHLIEVKAV